MITPFYERRPDECPKDYERRFLAEGRVGLLNLAYCLSYRAGSFDLVSNVNPGPALGKLTLETDQIFIEIVGYLGPDEATEIQAWVGTCRGRGLARDPDPEQVDVRALFNKSLNPHLRRLIGKQRGLRG